MKTFISFFLVGFFFFLGPESTAQPGSVSDFLKVDQFGYRPGDSKVAVLSDPVIGYNSALSYAPGTSFEVRNSSTNVIVHSGNIQQWNGGAVHAQSGDRGWWYDFSSLEIEGSYYVYDPTNNLSSFEFEINENIYAPILQAAGKMFYYNRCGMEKAAPFAESNWVDGDNFMQDETAAYIYDPLNAALNRDVSGGWFDAGDYNKYVNYSNNTIHDLLWAYQQSPNAFTDSWNIPESGNGIPDIIDEIKWELDWLLKMVNADGTVHLKVGSQSFSDNELAPPSANDDPRYYGPTCSSSEISAASMLAHGAIVFSEFTSLSSYANNLQVQAENIWSQVQMKLDNNTLETNCDDVSITASDSDRNVEEQRNAAFDAAIYLYALTSNANYNNYITGNISDSQPIELGLWDNYHLNDIDALMLYSSLPNADVTLSQSIISNFETSVSNNWNGYWDWSNDDLYRAPAPDWIYHWGSNSPKAAMGVLNYVTELYGLNPSMDFEKRYEETLHYFHGVNPQNICYLSNMYAYGAENSANEVYHTWFNDGTPWDNALTDLGPAPGFMAGGPNQFYDANTSLTPPYNQPPQKSYLDFNDGFPTNSWEITEPGIYYNAIYLRLISLMSTPIDPGVTLALKAFLQGPFEDNTNLMNDALRQQNFIPLSEPYTALGFNHIGGGSESISPSVLSISGNNAIVDWVFVELRDGNSPTTILATQSALIQRDGDIVSTDGVSNVTFDTPASSVHVALRHRHHHGFRTATSYSTSSTISLDFTSNAVNLYGINPTNSVGEHRVMISGDANIDGQVNVVDLNNFWRLQNGNPFNYFTNNADFDCNGLVNSVDRNFFLRPNNTRIEQLD